MSTIHVWNAHAVQQVANLTEVQGAEKYGSLGCGGREVLSTDNLMMIDSCCRGFVSPILAGMPHSAETHSGSGLRGQHGVHRVGKQRHRRMRTGHIRKHFAHEFIQIGAMLLVKVSTSAQLADILTQGLHLPQSTRCVEGILGRRRT